MAKDPPIGRIGYVIQGFGEGKAESPSRREFCCNNCRSWQDAALYICPACEHPRPGFNKRLRSAQLDNHLLGYAHQSSQQATMAPITSDVLLP